MMAHKKPISAGIVYCLFCSGGKEIKANNRNDNAAKAKTIKIRENGSSLIATVLSLVITDIWLLAISSYSYCYY